MATITCSPLIMNDEIDEAVSYAADVIVKSFFEQNGLTSPKDRSHDDGSDDTYYELQEQIREALLSAIPNEVFPDEMEVEEEDSSDIIDELDLNGEMTCDEIFEAVFDHIRDHYDGQVSDNMIIDEVEATTEEICELLEVEYHPQEEA